MTEREYLAATRQIAADLRIPSGCAYLLFARAWNAARGVPNPCLPVSSFGIAEVSCER